MSAAGGRTRVVKTSATTRTTSAAPRTSPADARAARRAARACACPRAGSGASVVRPPARGRGARPRRRRRRRVVRRPGEDAALLRQLPVERRELARELLEGAAASARCRRCAPWSSRRIRSTGPTSRGARAAAPRRARAGARHPQRRAGGATSSATPARCGSTRNDGARSAAASSRTCGEARRAASSREWTVRRGHPTTAVIGVPHRGSGSRDRGTRTSSARAARRTALPGTRACAGSGAPSTRPCHGACALRRRRGTAGRARRGAPTQVDLGACRGTRPPWP